MLCDDYTVGAKQLHGDLAGLWSARVGGLRIVFAV
jgi:mRNA-degrading endonuclease RelE of RelBE toxin-antitoxin system